MPTQSALLSQPLLDSNQKIFAYFVPSDELDRLLLRVRELEAALARARTQRDLIASDFHRIMETHRPPEPSEDEWQSISVGSGGFQSLLIKLEVE